MCRNEVNADFWTESTHMFKERIQAYERTLSKYDDKYLQALLTQVEVPQNSLEKFQTHEHQFSEMIESYF